MFVTVIYIEISDKFDKKKSNKYISVPVCMCMYAYIYIYIYIYIFDYRPTVFVLPLHRNI